MNTTTKKIDSMILLVMLIVTLLVKTSPWTSNTPTDMQHACYCMKPIKHVPHDTSCGNRWNPPFNTVVVPKYIFLKF